MEKLRNDSTVPTKAIIYQFLIALEKCFGLTENEKIYIETLGDVTKSQSVQMEIKAFEEDLNDLHHNIWNTLKNWLDNRFNPTSYKHLLLHTTQNFSKQSSFKDWNSKDNQERKAILLNISNKYDKKQKKSETTQNLLTYVLAQERDEKLSEILEKFEILDARPKDKEFYELIKQKYAKVLSINKESFIDALLGFIISPEISSNPEGWIITYNVFTRKCSELINEFKSTTTIFPKTLSEYSPDLKEQKECANYQFVTKIKEIELTEEIDEAICEFIRTRKLISEELSKYQIDNSEYRIYENNIHRVYKTKFKRSSIDTPKAKQIQKSQSLYFEVTGSQPLPFRSFADTEIYFRNGLLHEMANENKGKEVIWKLEVNDE